MIHGGSRCDVQEGVLEVLAAKVGPAAGLQEADAASYPLVQLCRPESREAFRTEHDPFMDPRHRITSVLLAAPDLTSPTDTWFAASLGRPTDLDAVTSASIRTGALTVVIPEALLVSGGARPPTLHLVAQIARYGSDPTPLPISQDLPVVSPRITFPRLQHGRYQVWLQHRNRGLHMSPEVVVGERPVTVTVSDRSYWEEIAGNLPEP